MTMKLPTNGNNIIDNQYRTEYPKNVVGFQNGPNGMRCMAYKAYTQDDQNFTCMWYLH